LDAIGCSSAGIYINNRPRAASLFRGISPENFSAIEEMFLRIGKELMVPIEAINDGDVTALAGAMSLDVNGVLGIALGSSEAAGYVNPKGNITGWINELAFVPVDYNPKGPKDEWSGDIGCGAAAGMKLASRAGRFPPDIEASCTDVYEHLYAEGPGNRWAIRMDDPAICDAVYVLEDEFYPGVEDIVQAVERLVR